MSFHCPRCDAKTKVLSTRAEIRERVCLKCKNVFRTEEIEYEGPIPDGRVRERAEEKRNYRRTRREAANAIA